MQLQRPASLKPMENEMVELAPRDRALVALGAALGSNCVPCIEYHIPQARLAGLADQEIQAAIALADGIRQVPARKVLEAATRSLSPAAGEPAAAGAAKACACEGPGSGKAEEPPTAKRTLDSMAAMMSGMMAACGQSAPPATDAPATAKAACGPAKGGGCC